MAHSVCPQCRYFAAWAPSTADWSCTVFPGGIPGVIVAGDNDHSGPVAGDHGYRFTPIGEDGRQGVLPPPPDKAGGS